MRGITGLRLWRRRALGRGSYELVKGRRDAGVERAQERRDRRAALDVPEWKKRQIAARAATVERLSQQGISPRDLKKEYDRGFDEGFMAAAEPITKGCYAAVCLALKELHGFGHKRCLEVLRHIDDQLVYTMDGQELADKVLDEMGLEIHFREALDRVQEKD